MIMRTRISGSMSKTYLSEIGKSDAVNSRVRMTALQAQTIAEGIANGVGRSRHAHTKMSTLGPGIWNSTYILHANSAIVRKNAKNILNNAASRAGARMKGR